MYINKSIYYILFNIKKQMKLKFIFIFFCLILSVISLNLKKKNENKKSLNGSFLQNKLGQSSACNKSSYKKKSGESCDIDDQCINYWCVNGKCAYFGSRKDIGEYCACDYHCLSGHCSYWYWAFKTYYHCTKN